MAASYVCISVFLCTIFECSSVGVGGVGLDMVAGLDLITLTLHAEATTVLALSEARQNISKPWPYLEETEDKKRD